LVVFFASDSLSFIRCGSFNVSVACATRLCDFFDAPVFPIGIAFLIMNTGFAVDADAF